MGHAEGPLSRLGAALARAQERELQRLALPTRGAELVATVLRRERVRRVATRACALALVLAALSLLWLRPRPPSFELDNGSPGVLAAWISAAAAPLALRFSDGSVLTLRARRLLREVHD